MKINDKKFIMAWAVKLTFNCSTGDERGPILSNIAYLEVLAQEEKDPEQRIPIHEVSFHMLKYQQTFPLKRIK